MKTRFSILMSLLWVALSFGQFGHGGSGSGIKTVADTSGDSQAGKYYYSLADSLYYAGDVAGHWHPVPIMKISGDTLMLIGNLEDMILQLQTLYVLYQTTLYDTIQHILADSITARGSTLQLGSMAGSTVDSLAFWPNGGGIILGFLNSPSANEMIMQLGTSNDVQRWLVDEDGDVLQDGTLGVGISTAPATEMEISSTLATSPRGIMSSQYTTDSKGARFHGRKARGTRASPTTIVTGDTLARWVASGYSGSAYLEMASIVMGTSGTIGTTRVPTWMSFSTATDAAPSVLTEHVRINNAGLVTFHDGSIPSWGHSPTGLGVEGIAEFDGNLFADATATLNEAIVNTTLLPDADQGANIGATGNRFNLIWADSIHANNFGGSDFTLGSAGDSVTFAGAAWKGEFVIRDSLRVGSFAVTKAGSVRLGSWNATEIAVAKGGTGAATAANARTNLGVLGLTALRDSVSTNFMGDGISWKLTSGGVKVNLDYNGGIETIDDSLNIKLDGVTLALSSAGLKVTDSIFQPLEATLTDIADGTIAENLVNTDNPWADNEVADDITASNYTLLTAFGDSLVNYEGNGIKITDLASIDVLVDYNGGIEIIDDSLNIKLNSAELELAAAGLSIASSMTRDEEWNTQTDVETVWGVTLATDTELSAMNDSTWNIATLGSDVQNASGQLNFVASDNDLGSAAITTGDQLSFTGFSGGVDIDGNFTAGLITSDDDLRGVDLEVTGNVYFLNDIYNANDFVMYTTGPNDHITIDPNSGGAAITNIGVSGDADSLAVFGNSSITGSLNISGGLAFDTGLQLSALDTICTPSGAVRWITGTLNGVPFYAKADTTAV